MLKAVLFDLDNTLIDWSESEPWEDFIPPRLQRVLAYIDEQIWPVPDVALDAFFEEYAIRLTVAWETGVETLRAPSIARILIETAERFGVPAGVLQAEAVLEAYDWQPPQGQRAYPDVIDVLPQLAAHGVALGIVTNASAPMRLRDRELVAVNIFDHFPLCRVSAADVGVLKPHRRIFEHALTLIDAQPHEAVFVGDNLDADIRGAQRAGLKAVWRCSTPGEKPVSRRGPIAPDGTVVTLHEMLPLLDDWFPGWRNGGAPSATLTDDPAGGDA